MVPNALAGGHVFPECSRAGAAEGGSDRMRIDGEAGRPYRRARRARIRSTTLTQSRQESALAVGGQALPVSRPLR